MKQVVKKKKEKKKRTPADDTQSECQAFILSFLEISGCPMFNIFLVYYEKVTRTSKSTF